MHDAAVWILAFIGAIALVVGADEGVFFGYLKLLEWGMK